MCPVSHHSYDRITEETVLFLTPYPPQEPRRYCDWGLFSFICLVIVVLLFFACLPALLLWHVHG